MPDLATRKDHEDEVALLILLYLEDAKYDYATTGRVDWLLWTTNLSRELVPVLAATYLESAEQLAGGFEASLADANSRAMQWATNQANWLAASLATTTQNAIYAAAMAAGVNVNAATAEQWAQVLNGVEATFGTERAESASITETTGAITEGEVFAASELDRFGINLIAFWRSEHDDKVCPICRPLDGRPSEEWWSSFGTGPPAHPRCRCTLEWRPES